MIQKTTWTPDTCSCQITFAWDDQVPEGQRVFTVDKANPCPEHTGTLEQVFAKVLEENQNKNKVLGHVVENFPSVYEEVNGEKQLKEGIEYNWSFDSSRNLEVEFVGVDKSEVPLIQDSLDSELGLGKVTVK